ncbi:response regulator [Pseudodesulfovibrio cashew]|uniref:Sensory/regulatory protein RpfC n=1 Tax=Pseudodesulfovibrio cashew TaxID=2678688 RepID=A0A6I6JJW4_9BACT|nr:ATP-binding protein [Pseudodesulfovibrio cashew]QGY41310.1 response regulator [Pseudodesulfovibrio cashew]
MASFSLRQLVQRNLTFWMLIPSISLIMLLGAYAAYEKSKDFEARNTVLTQVLAKHITEHASDSQSALGSLANSITRYDPFWFQWMFSNFLLAYPYFEQLIYVDIHGRIRATYPQKDSTLFSMDLFLDKATSKVSILSAPIPSAISHNLVIYIGVRLSNNDILLGELSLTSLQNHVQELLPQEQGNLVLMDSYGNLISHSDFQRVERQENIGNLSIIRNHKSKTTLTAVYKDDGVYRIGTVANIPRTNWQILISKPLKDVFLPILSPLLALLTVILCLFIMFAQFLLHRLKESVVEPLADFTQSIELTAQGNYRKPENGRQVFSELAIIQDEFDKMVLHVDKREGEIKESEERFRQLVENIHEAFWITETENNSFIYVSPSYEMIWGRTRESLYGNPESFFLAIDNAFRFRVLERFNRVRTEGRILDEEFQIIMPDGKKRWLRAQSFPVYDGDGKCVRMVGLAENISDRKAIQLALVKAKQAAESASQAKTEFLTNISHELRTPLNGILGMLQLTQSTPLNAEQSDYINTAISSSKVLLNVINDILNIAQIEAGKLTLREQLFKPHEILETIYKFFKLSTESKELRLRLDVEPGLPPYLLGDEVRIRQILFNLVGNSVKFTEEGGIDITVKALPYSNKPKTVNILFTITDTGIGIPHEKISYVFESFTQVDGTYTRSYQGTGLGLGIVKKLVELMNGSITVDSCVGKGTTIYVTLQLAVPSNEQISNSKALSRHVHQAKRKLSILVAEDDRVNQIAIKRMIQKLGHTAICVSDGEKALRLLKEEPFDCVFMDIQMPVMDGIETTKQIRTSKELEAVADIPIVALTAHAMPEDRDKFLRVGMSDYISKPVSFEELAQTLANIQ